MLCATLHPRQVHLQLQFAAAGGVPGQRIPAEHQSRKHCEYKTRSGYLENVLLHHNLQKFVLNVKLCVGCGRLGG